MRVLLIFFFLITVSFQLKAQDAADSLLNDLTADTEQVKLLPDKMLLTQRIFWGENGIYRKVGIAPKLTAENRQRELRIRRNMFKIHQGVGIATAAGMLLQGYLGSRMYKFNGKGDFNKIKNAHEATAIGINIAYGTTALMAFTAPPKQISRRGLNSGNVHKTLSYIHLTGMITTNVLANRLEKDLDTDNRANIKKFHRAAAFTTFGTFYAAIAVLKFDF